VTVEATHFGTMAIVIIGIALAVFVITAIGRAIRRGIRPPGGDEGGPDGTAAADGDEDAVLTKDGAAENGVAEDRAGEDGAGETGPSEPDPDYARPEADTVERERARRSPAAKEPDEHASTPGWADRG
jgi:hypothetical protein